MATDNTTLTQGRNTLFMDSSSKVVNPPSRDEDKDNMENHAADDVGCPLIQDRRSHGHGTTTAAYQKHTNLIYDSRETADISNTDHRQYLPHYTQNSSISMEVTTSLVCSPYPSTSDHLPYPQTHAELTEIEEGQGLCAALTPLTNGRSTHIHNGLQAASPSPSNRGQLSTPDHFFRQQQQSSPVHLFTQFQTEHMDGDLFSKPHPCKEPALPSTSPGNYSQKISSDLGFPSSPNSTPGTSVESEVSLPPSNLQLALAYTEHPFSASSTTHPTTHPVLNQREPDESTKKEYATTSNVNTTAWTEAHHPHISDVNRQPSPQLKAHHPFDTASNKLCCKNSNTGYACPKIAEHPFDNLHTASGIHQDCYFHKLATSPRLQHQDSHPRQHPKDTGSPLLSSDLKFTHPEPRLSQYQNLPEITPHRFPSSPKLCKRNDFEFSSFENHHNIQINSLSSESEPFSANCMIDSNRLVSSFDSPAQRGGESLGHPSARKDPASTPSHNHDSRFKHQEVTSSGSWHRCHRAPEQIPFLPSSRISPEVHGDPNSGHISRSYDNDEEVGHISGSYDKGEEVGHISRSYDNDEETIDEINPNPVCLQKLDNVRVGLLPDYGQCHTNMAAQLHSYLDGHGMTQTDHCLVQYRSGSERISMPSSIDSGHPVNKDESLQQSNTSELDLLKVDSETPRKFLLPSSPEVPSYTNLCLVATLLNPPLGLLAFLCHHLARTNFRLRRRDRANNLYFATITLSTVAIFVTLVSLALLIGHSLVKSPTAPGPSSSSPTSAADQCHDRLFNHDDTLQKFFHIDTDLYCQVSRNLMIMNALKRYMVEDIHTRQLCANKSSNSPCYRNSASKSGDEPTKTLDLILDKSVGQNDVLPELKSISNSPKMNTQPQLPQSSNPHPPFFPLLPLLPQPFSSTNISKLLHNTVLSSNDGPVIPPQLQEDYRLYLEGQKQVKFGDFRKTSSTSTSSPISGHPNPTHSGSIANSPGRPVESSGDWRLKTSTEAHGHSEALVAVTSMTPVLDVDLPWDITTVSENDQA